VKKQVYYAAGLLGVTPGLGLLAAAAPATAATHVPGHTVTGHTGKRVALQRNASPAVRGCDGSVPWSNVAFKFWHRTQGASTCIGTVSARADVAVANEVRIRIYGHESHAHAISWSQVKPVTSPSGHVYFSVHRWFGNKVKMCEAHSWNINGCPVVG